MVPEQIEDIYALAPMQQGMLFDFLRAPEAGFYCDQTSYRLRGEFKAAAFEQAWQEVIQRHACLRSAFLWQGINSPVQVVSRQVKGAMQHFDWRAFNESEKKEKLETFLREDRRRGFDLTVMPLLRLSLLRLEDDLYEFVYSHYHGITDGWSNALILKEVAARYEGHCNGRQIQLPAPSAYRDFIAWIQEQDLDAAEAFWKERISTFSNQSAIDLGQRPSAGEQASKTELVQSLAADLSSRLNEVARKRFVTLNTIIQAAWAILLSRYADREDVIFGSTVSGRPPGIRGIETMVGLFINTLPTFVTVKRQEKISDFFVRLQADQAEAYQYQYTSLAEIYRWSEATTTAPLFNSLLVFQNFSTDAFERAFTSNTSTAGERTVNLAVEAVIASETRPYPLTLVVYTDRNIGMTLTCNDGSFTQSALARLLRQITNILEQLAGGSDCAVGDLTLSSPEERSYLLQECNATRCSWARFYSVHQVFADWARRSPAAIAAIYDGQQITYQELNTRANRLALYLQQLGIGPDSRVALCVHRSIEMITGMLAILKAGAAYVPIDPEDPPERIARILDDAQVMVILSQQTVAQSLPAHWAQLICVDTSWDEIPQFVEETPENRTHPDHLAYVIYTSGSSGSPKGVMITHRALTNHMNWMLGQFNFTPEDCVLQKTPFTFDASVWEFMAPWMSGGCLMIARPHGHQDPDYLRQILAEGKVTVLQVVPTLLKALLESELPPANSLKFLFCGGEALSSALVSKAQELLNTRVINLYGPTEATIDSSFFEGNSGGAVTSIGNPIANSTAYVLDRLGNLAPQGVAGELYLGGLGLARGYLSQAALTADRFVPDHLSGEFGARLYRTGDRARRSDTGSLEYLGRSDDQVKIRGYRIELGEVESALNGCTGISRAVVVAHHSEKEKRLIAYVIPVPGQTLDREEIFRRLRAKLPEYMVPTLLLELEDLPKTRSGKTDRRALAAKLLPVDENSRNVDKSLTEVEEMVAGIWKQVMQVEEVGVEENFFELGGHSLLATQIVSRVREVLGVEVGLRELFEYPTVRGLSGQIEKGQRVERPRVEAVERDGREMPLSYAQQRMWFIEQLEPGSGAYHIPVAVRMKGKVEEGGIRVALERIVERHEVLRSGIVEEGGEARARVGVGGGLELAVIDLEEVKEEEREEKARELGREQARRPFDLSKGPFLRLLIVRLGEEERVLELVMHHIVSDGWSMGVLVEEFTEFYREHVEGRRAEVGELRIQYADYAVWQREWLRGEVVEEQMKYWKGELAELPVLELPVKKGRGGRGRKKKEEERGGGRVRLEVGEKLSRKLQRMSEEEGVTLFMTLLACYQVLLWRYTGQKEVVVGTDVANRTRGESEGLIGFFVNQLVLRTKVEGGERFVELLKRVREMALGAYAHQDLPFEQLVEELQPERDLERTPLFQAKIMLENAPARRLTIPGVELGDFVIDNGHAAYELMLALLREEHGVSGVLEYAAELFDAGMMERMGEHYVRLLEEVVRDRERPVEELEMLGEQEREELVAGRNGTEREWEKTGSVVERIAVQARRTPEAIAIEEGDRKITYSSLERSTSSLAQYLRALGVRTETRVALILGHRSEMILAMLATLKAGGTYLPLDPEEPANRLSHMLEDSNASMIVTVESLRDSLPQTWLPIVALDGDVQWDGLEICEEPDILPSSLAYLIYTSGSSGIPKGVGIPHESLACREAVLAREYSLQPSDRLLHAVSPSFDAFAAEVFPALGSGATILMYGKTLSLDEQALLDLIDRVNPTILHIPAAYNQRLMEYSRSRNARLASSVRLMITGGEAMPASLAEAWTKHYGISVVNEYGPTEATITSTLHKISADTAAREGSLSMGTPIVGVQAYVVGKHGCLMPEGLTGEFLVGGEGLARGYMGQPGRTAELFIPDYLSGTNGGRLYRTGDLVRWSPDRKLDFVGRVDEQVKIRGYRVEPAEIEAALAQHPNVRQGVVVARQTQAGDTKLYAYLSTSNFHPLSVADLRAYLKTKIPEYMVPAAFIWLKELPLNKNGKIDRQSLPEPFLMEQTVEEDGALTPMQELMARIWGPLLERTSIRPYHNFFEIGGHSLLATRMISRIRETLGVEMQLKTIFDAPTLSLFADEFEKCSRLKMALPAPLLVPSECNHAPLSFAQKRLWLAHQLDPDSRSYTITVAARLAGNLDCIAMVQSLRTIIQRHEMLRTCFPVLDGEPRQQVVSAEEIPIMVLDFEECGTAASEAHVRSVIEELRGKVFDLASPPLMRILLCRLTSQEHILAMSMHHIVGDGWSVGLFIEELNSLYEAKRAGRPSPLAPLPIQYRDFAEWQQKAFHGEYFESLLVYWSSQLKGLIPARIPSDFRKPAVRLKGARGIDMEMPVDILKTLHRRAEAETVTHFMIFAAALQVLVARYANVKDVAIGTSLANRNRTETEPLIGYFVNQVVLRQGFPGDPTMLDALRSSRRTILDAYLHQDAPFDYLVEKLNPHRSPDENPFFQILLVFQNVPSAALQLTDSTMSDFVLKNPASDKFDMTFFIFESQKAITVSLNYNADIYSEETITTFLDRYQTVIRHFAESPETRLSALPFSTGGAVLAGFNDVLEIGA